MKVCLSRSYDCFICFYIETACIQRSSIEISKIYFFTTSSTLCYIAQKLRYDIPLLEAGADPYLENDKATSPMAYTNDESIKVIDT